MKQIKIGDLIPQVDKYMRDELMRADITIRNLKYHWYEVQRYMEASEIPLFDRNVCRDFIQMRIGNFDYISLSKAKRKIFRAVTDLADYLEFGCIHRGIHKSHFDFNGEIGSLMHSHIEAMKLERMSEGRIKNHRYYLYVFLLYLTDKEVYSIRNLSESHIYDHIRNLNPKKPSLPHHTTAALKGFFRYLYSEKILNRDFAKIIPKCCRLKQPLLPSVYSTAEIQKVINSVDRSSIVGKRDYAILLLAAKLGLRSSDIYSLKFEHIKWEHSRIELSQIKTGGKLELPLLPEIGNAIIEYLQYGRPKLSSPYIFLINQSPYNPMTVWAVNNCVSKYYKESGVDTYRKKRGPHSLRHSVAKAMLDNKVVLPVISEVLGHASMESTKYYLRVDTQSLSQCALDVPVMNTEFYEQNNRFFYGK